MRKTLVGLGRVQTPIEMCMKFVEHLVDGCFFGRMDIDPQPLKPPIAHHHEMPCAEQFILGTIASQDAHRAIGDFSAKAEGCFAG
jgi:hypothetical protein